MKKHILSFISMLCAAILAAIIVSCGSKSTEQQQAAPVAQQQAGPMGGPAGPGAISAEERAAQTKRQERFMALYDSLTAGQKNTFFTHVKHQYVPQVKKVAAGKVDSDPPADAIVLFDGTDINKEWEEAGRPAAGSAPGGTTGAAPGGTTRAAPGGTAGAAPGGTSNVKPAVTWVIKNGGMESAQGSGSIRTKRSFTDFQLHIEWKTSTTVTGTEVPGYPGQYMGNSGITFAGGYELQILDSYDPVGKNYTYANGQAGAVYMQYAPLVNVSRKPGEWQSFDILYTSPRFKDDTTYFTPPRITVFHNGVLIQNNVSIQGPTSSPGIPKYTIRKHEIGPISLQRHGDPVSFRNVWIREL
jgi:hypothetical protein